MNPDPDRPTRVRRTQAERSASTRARILETTVRCLCERGFAATTTLLVAAEAGVSRGAMLHHFPTKADLMTYVVQVAYEEEMPEYETRFSVISDPRDRLLAFPEIVWEVLSRPVSVAVLEIFLGSRSDPEMRARLSPLLADITRTGQRRLATLFADISLPNLRPQIRLVVWAVRGLSLSRQLEPHLGDPAPSVALLRRLFEDLLPQGDPVEGGLTT